MLTYPWKCTVLHCNHLGNTYKPLVLMTQHFDYCPSASEGDNQSVRSSAPVVYRCFPGGYNVKLYISRGRLAWWLLAFLCCGLWHQVNVLASLLTIYLLEYCVCQQNNDFIPHLSLDDSLWSYSVYLQWFSPSISVLLCEKRLISFHVLFANAKISFQLLLQRTPPGNWLKHRFVLQHASSDTNWTKNIVGTFAFVQCWFHLFYYFVWIDRLY